MPDIDFSKYESKPDSGKGIDFDSVFDSERQMADSIARGAAELGIDPEDYATAISYESAKTFDPWVKGPVTQWGQHRGTIQYGEPQRKTYGVYKGQSFDEQVTKSNVKYLRDAGVKPGMKFADIYTAINGGRVGKAGSTPDANTGRTIADNIRIAEAEHRPLVRQRFGQFFTDSSGQVRPIAQTGTPAVQPSVIAPGFPADAPQITQDDVTAFNERFPMYPVADLPVPQTPAAIPQQQTAQVQTPAQPTADQAAIEADYQKWLSTMEGYTDAPERRAEYNALLGQSGEFNKQINAPAIAQDQAAMDAWNRQRAQEIQAWRANRQGQLSAAPQAANAPATDNGLKSSIYNIDMSKKQGAFYGEEHNRQVAAALANELKVPFEDALAVVRQTATKTQENGPASEEYISQANRVQVGADIKQRILTYSKDVGDLSRKLTEQTARYQSTLNPDEPPSTAQIRAARDLGLITEADAEKQIKEEVDVMNRLRSESRPWFADGSVIAGVETPEDANIRQQATDRAYIENILKDYGSLAAYKKEQDRLREEYKYRPAAHTAEFVRNLGGAIPKAVASILKTADIALNMNPLKMGADAIQGKDFTIDETVLTEIGDKINRTLQAGQNKDLKNNLFVTVLPDTLGQLGVQIAAGVLSGGATVPTAIGASMGAAAQYDEAKKFNATEKQKLLAAVVGAAAAVPDAVLFSKWFKANPESHAGFFKKLQESLLARIGVRFGNDIAKETVELAMPQIVRRVVIGSLGEGTQEVSENKINDITAYLGYDPSPARYKQATTLTDEDFVSFLAGAVGGGLAGGFLGKTVRGISPDGTETTVRIDPDGSVKLLKGQVENPDIEMYFNEQAKVWQAKNQPPEQAPVQPREPVANLRENNPTRIEVADPAAVQKAGIDTRVRKVTDALKNEKDFIDIDQLAKKTRMNRTNLEDAIMTLYGARMVEMLPGNKVKLIDPTEVAKQTDLYTRAQNYGQTPEVPPQSAPAAPTMGVPETAATSQTQGQVTGETGLRPAAPAVQDQAVAPQTPDKEPEWSAPKEYDEAPTTSMDKARQEGRYSKDGVEYVRQEPITQAPAGKTGKVRFADAEPDPSFTYRLIEADMLQPADLGGMENRQHFMPEAQPKDRSTKASKEASDNIGRNADLAQVAESPNAYAGAPVVNSRGEVIQGNNRAEGLKKHYGFYQGPDRKYKRDLANQAERFGFNPTQVEMMDKPVLVRQIDADDETAIRLGQYTFNDLESGGNQRVNPITTATRIPYQDKQKIVEDIFRDAPEDATLAQIIRDNDDLIKIHLDPYLTNTQKETLINADKRLTPDAIKDITAVFKHFVFDKGDEHLPEMFEGMPHYSKEGIVASLPRIFGVEQGKSLVRDIQNAIVALTDYNGSGITDWQTWVRQPDMIGGTPAPIDLYTPLELELAKRLNDPKSQKEIKDIFSQYAKLANGSEGDLFEGKREPLSKAEAVKEVFGIEHIERTSKDDAAKSPRSEEAADGGTRDQTVKPEPVSAAIEQPEPRPETAGIERAADGDVEGRRPTLHGVPPQELDPVLTARVLYAKERKTPTADIAERYNLTIEQVESVGALPNVGQGGQMSFKLIQGLTPSKTSTPEERADKVAKVNDLVSELDLPVENRVTRDSLPGEVKTTVDAIRLAIANELGAERASHLTPSQWLKWLDAHADKLTQETVGTILDALGHQIDHIESKVNPFIADARLTRTLEKLHTYYDIAKLPDFDGIPNRDIKRAILDLGYEYGLKETAIKRAYQRGRAELLAGIQERTDEGTVPRRSGEDTSESTAKPAETRSGNAEELEYFKGDAIELTGNVTTDKTGHEWEEFRYLEGPKQGQIGERPTKRQKDANVAEKQQEQQEQQEQQGAFRRVREANEGRIIVARPALESEKPESPSKATESKVAEKADAFTVNPDDIPYNLALAAYHNSSFSPEKRAKQVQEEYVSHVTAVYDEFLPLAKTDEQKAILDAEIERYRQGYVEREKAILSAQSRTASSMITGPANFPAERNRKRLAVVDKRVKESIEWSKKAQAAIEKRLLNARTPEAKADEIWNNFKRGIDQSIEWQSPTNLAGRLERIANNGNVDLLTKALDYIRERQKSLPKPLFTERHSVWQLPEKAASIVKTPAPTGTVTIAEYDGAKVVNNKDIERVQILFDERPSPETIKILKKSGWRWSPREGAWQRQNTQNGIYNSEYVLNQAGFTKSEPVQAETLPEKPDAGNVNLFAKTTPIPGQVDLWGNATAMHNLQQDLFGDMSAPSTSAKDVSIKRENVTVPKETQDFISGMQRSENPKVRHHAEAISSLATDAFTQDQAKIVEAAADALDIYSRALNANATVQNMLDQNWLGQDVQLTARAKQFARAMERGTFPKVLGEVLAGKDLSDTPLFMVAWHGSPHKFDKFDISKIGTGEGAQAYGYGLYFADSEAVADHYKTKLSERDQTWTYKGKTYFENIDSLDDLSRTALSRISINFLAGDADFIAKTKRNADATVKTLENIIAYLNGERRHGRDNPVQLSSYDKGTLEALLANGINPASVYERETEIRDKISDFNPADFAKQSGVKYRVDLKPKQDEYLLWDKPLSEQSEKVKKALATIGIVHKPTQWKKTTYFGREKWEADKVGDDTGDIWVVQNNRGSYQAYRGSSEIGPIVSTADRAKEVAQQFIDQRIDNGKSVYEKLALDKARSVPFYSPDGVKNNTWKGGQKAASEYLKSLGIRGIKYLDGPSRSKGEGNYNYVIFDDADVEIQEVHFNKPAMAAETKRLNHDITKLLAKARKGPEHLISEATFEYNPKTGLVDVNTAGLTMFMAAIDAQQITGATIPGGGYAGVRETMVKGYMKLWTRGKTDAAKKLESFILTMDASRDPESGAVAISLAEPKYPKITKYSAQEESGHLADMKAQYRYAGLRDAEPFIEADAKAYATARRAIMANGYPEKLVHPEFLGKIQRDDAADELNLTQEQVDDFRDIRLLQLKRAGMSSTEFVDIYGKVSESNKRSAEKYASQYSLPARSGKYEREAVRDESAIPEGGGGRERSGSDEGSFNLARTSDRPDRPQLRLREVPEADRGLDKLRETALRTAERSGDQTETPDFAAWFKDSKVVDENGKPLRVYHGTAQDFDAFNEVAEGIDGIFFSASPEVASGYAQWRGESGSGGANVRPVYLSLQNPLIVDGRGEIFDAEFFQDRVDEAKLRKKDGVIFRNVRDGWKASDPQSNTYVTFKPTQIKSAIGNNGTFDPNDPNILHSKTDALARRTAKADLAKIREAMPESDILFARTPAPTEAEISFFKKWVLNPKTRETSIKDIVVNFRRAGLLTGPKTHLRNMLSNAINQGTEEVARIPAWIADIVASTATGERAVQFPSVPALAKSFRTLVTADETLKALDQNSGIARAWHLLKNGSIEELAKNQVQEMKSGAPLLDMFVNSNFRLLGAEDALFKTFALRRSLEEQAKTQAQTESKNLSVHLAEGDRGKFVRERTADLLKNPTKAMLLEGMLYADFVTFTNDNPISDLFKKVKDLNTTGKAVLEIVVPYDRTPTNIVLRAIEHTPAGLVWAGKHLYDRHKGKSYTFDNLRKRYADAYEHMDANREAGRRKVDAKLKDALRDIEAEIKSAETSAEKDFWKNEKKRVQTVQAKLKAKRSLKDSFRAEDRQEIEDAFEKIFPRVQQKMFAMSFGRSTMGSAVLMLGFYLASKGLMSGFWDPSEYDESNEFYKRRDAGILNGALTLGNRRYQINDTPTGKVMVLGASMWERSQRKPKKGETGFDKLFRDVTDVGGETITEQPLLNSLDDYFGRSKSVQKRVGGLLGSFVPTILADVADVTDTSERTRRNETLYDPALNRIPGARQSLPESKYVRDPHTKKTVNRVINRFDPTSSRPVIAPKNQP